MHEQFWLAFYFLFHYCNISISGQDIRRYVFLQTQTCKGAHVQKLASCDEVLLKLQAINMVKRTPAYKNRLKALELERTGGITNKKKGHKQLDR